MNINEERIREFAYQIWQSEGKPHGHAKRHWEMACKLAESNDVKNTKQSTPAKTSKAAPKINAQPAEISMDSETAASNKKTKPVDKKIKENKVADKKPIEKKPVEKKVTAKKTPTEKTLNSIETKKTAIAKKTKAVENESI